jgi:hypothetical protein
MQPSILRRQEESHKNRRVLSLHRLTLALGQKLSLVPCPA